jgi:murein DD-endopeptidase MepM/ murein hydrolase activator NlpD
MELKNKRILILLMILVGVVLLATTFRVSATPRLDQVYLFTPTALADGRIMYVVKSGDNCTSIALLMGISEQQLRLNNNLTDPNCVLQVGQQLLITTVTPAPVATNTATPSGPTSTPFFGLGKICILLFLDVNGNGLADATEGSIAAGAISITDRTGQTSLTGTTDATGSPVCFDQLPEGDYNITVAIPEGYNATTNLNYATAIKAGDSVYLDFGAQPGSGASSPFVIGDTRSPILGILGGLLILVGAGLAFYFFRARK